MAVSLVGILVMVVVLLAACAVVIAILSNPKWLKWAAIPAAVLVLLAGIVIAIRFSAPSSIVPGIEVPARWETRSDLPRVVVASELDAEAITLNDKLSTEAIRLNDTLSTEAQRLNAELNADAQRMNRELQAQSERLNQILRSQHATAARQHAAMQRSLSASPQVRTASRARLALLGAPVVLMLIVGGIVVAQRGWIARHAGIVVPIAGVGFLGLMVLVGVFVFYLRMASVHESARRTEIVARLRAMGETMHAAARESEPGPPPPPTPVGAAVSIETGEAVAEAADTTDTPAAPETTAAGEAPDQASGDAAAVPAQPVPVILPDWIREHQGDINDIEQNPIVLASDQWATVEESERQLEQAAAAAVAHQLQRQRSELGDWSPSIDFVHQCGAIQQRFVEQTSLQVGEFESPMYRSYWQVVITPGIADLAYSQWQESAVDERLSWLGGGAAGMTLLFGMIAAMLRIDSATGGRYRGHMLAAAGFSTTLVASLFLLG